MAEPGQNIYLTELEGVKAPLGVILYLIKRDNLDIYDIPIARITKEYLEYLDMMEQLQIELAGEFFVLAATLMRIKAQMLLRKKEAEEDPREELVRRLLEYRKMVEAAKSLKEMEEERLKVFTRPVLESEKITEMEVKLELSLFELMRAFRDIMGSFEEGEGTTEIPVEEITIEDKIEAILCALSGRKPVSFPELFTLSSSRLELIVTFIALLELIRLSRVMVRQEGSFGTIWLYPAAGEGAERSGSSGEDDSTESEYRRQGEDGRTQDAE